MLRWLMYQANRGQFEDEIIEEAPDSPIFDNIQDSCFTGWRIPKNPTFPSSTLIEEVDDHPVPLLPN